VSTKGQSDNLQNQVAHLLKFVEDRGGTVLSVYEQVGPGSEVSWLNKAATEAIDSRAVLLAHTTNRFIRPPREDRRTQPRVIDFQRLWEATFGARLVTATDPTASNGVQQGAHIEIGQAAKGKGGRPGKQLPRGKARREALLPHAIRLRAQGRGYRQIADELNKLDPSLPNVCPKTVRNWLTPDYDGGQEAS